MTWDTHTCTRTAIVLPDIFRLLHSAVLTWDFPGLTQIDTRTPEREGDCAIRKGAKTKVQFMPWGKTKTDEMLRLQWNIYIFRGVFFFPLLFVFHLPATLQGGLRHCHLAPFFLMCVWTVALLLQKNTHINTSWVSCPAIVNDVGLSWLD